MSNSRADWPTLHKQYVQGDMSLSKLAEDNGLVRSTVIARSAKDGWQEEREKFRKGVTVGTLQALIDGQAGELVSARGEAIDALRKGVKKFVEQLLIEVPTKIATAYDAAGRETAWTVLNLPFLRVNPRDLATLIDKVAMLSGQPTNISRVESESNVHISAAIEQLSAADLLRLAERAGDGLPDDGPASGSPLPRLADPDPARNGA